MESIDALEGYKLHLERLYDAVEHFFSWMKGLNRDAKEPDGFWIESFLHECQDLDNGFQSDGCSQIPWCRAMLQRNELEVTGWSFMVKYMLNDGLNSTTFIPKQMDLIVGFYFPPELYPAENGVYPTVMVYANDMNISTIELDGTRRLYKPIDKTLWIHHNLAKLLSFSCDTGGRPYYVIGIIDLTDINKESLDLMNHTMMTIGQSQRIRSYLNATIGFLNSRDVDFIQLLNKPYVLSYSQVHAANLIKRCWIKYSQRKKRRLIGTEITLMPDRGVVVAELIDKYPEMRGQV